MLMNFIFYFSSTGISKVDEFLARVWAYRTIISVRLGITDHD